MICLSEKFEFEDTRNVSFPKFTILAYTVFSKIHIHTALNKTRNKKKDKKPLESYWSDFQIKKHCCCYQHRFAQKKTDLGKSFTQSFLNLSLNLLVSFVSQKHDRDVITCALLEKKENRRKVYRLKTLIFRGSIEVKTLQQSTCFAVAVMHHKIIKPIFFLWFQHYHYQIYTHSLSWSIKSTCTERKNKIICLWRFSVIQQNLHYSSM